MGKGDSGKLGCSVTERHEDEIRLSGWKMEHEGKEWSSWVRENSARSGKKC